MQKQSTKNRRGDTSRTSSQGRKLASGETKNKMRGNPEINENTGNEAKEENQAKLKVPPGAIKK